MAASEREFLAPAFGARAGRLHLERWSVAVGDRIVIGRPVCTVDLGDGETAELRSPYAGNVTGLAIGPGDPFSVGDVLMTVANDAIADGRPPNDPTTTFPLTAPSADSSITTGNDEHSTAEPATGVEDRPTAGPTGGPAQPSTVDGNHDPTADSQEDDAEPAASTTPSSTDDPTAGSEEQAEAGSASEHTADVGVDDEAGGPGERRTRVGAGGDAGERETAAESGESRAPALSPLARRLAEEFNVDVSKLTGTGPRGRITRSDVQRAAFPEDEEDLAEEADPLADRATSGEPADELVERDGDGDGDGERRDEGTGDEPAERTVTAEAAGLDHAGGPAASPSRDGLGQPGTAGVSTVTTDVDATQLVRAVERLADADGRAFGLDVILAVLVADAVTGALPSEADAGLPIGLLRPGQDCTVDRPVVTVSPETTLADLSAALDAAGTTGIETAPPPSVLVIDAGALGVHGLTVPLQRGLLAAFTFGPPTATPVVDGDGLVVSEPRIHVTATFDAGTVDVGTATAVAARVNRSIEDPILAFAR